MVLADLGADVVRVRRPGGLQIPAEDLDLLHRGKRVVDLDVKSEPGKLLDLVAKADVLLDGFRPGTCERLGIGPVLAQMAWTMKSTGTLKDERESFMLDGGAPFYRTYETADGKFIAVGAIEPEFFAQLLAGLGLSAEDVPNQLDASAFPEVHKLFAEKFAGKTRDEWSEIFAGTDACVTPVLTWREAARNEHLRARSTLVTANGVDQAAPAPRFSRTPSGPIGAPPKTTTPNGEIN
jgi:crotonobetainyl-CoA:carnitine CoA-transferase CaiB-like acyl-CoA transferase